MIDFGRLGRCQVEGRLDGGSMTSDGGVMLLSATDRRLGLTAAAARCIADPRNPLLITHGVRDMLRTRMYGPALGWEDLNDHKALRCDVAIQTAVGAPHPAVIRLELAQRADLRAGHASVAQPTVAWINPPASETTDRKTPAPCAVDS
jgi:hypothetical protein